MRTGMGAGEAVGTLLLPRCSICRQVPAGGIRDGIKLRKGFICGNCEKEIMKIEIGSQQYEQIIDRIKAIIK